MSKTMRIGGRGEELLGLLYRFGGLTASQYRDLCPKIDAESREMGKRSGGNPWGRKLSSRVEDVRRWVRQGRSDAEIAVLLGMDNPDAVERFRRRRGIGEGGKG